MLKRNIESVTTVFTFCSPPNQGFGTGSELYITRGERRQEKS